MRHSFHFFKPLSAVASGILIASIGCSSAYGLNQFSYVSSCSTCQTTADFVTAAKATARGVESSGVYQIVSTAAPESAYIQITGSTVRGPSGETRFVVSTAVPIDSNGNSLAASSESANESFYATLDQVAFGANRSAPQTVNEPAEYAGSFINSTEEEVVPGIGAALIQKGINPGSIQNGTIITVKFSDGTTAQYVKVSSTSSYQWTWTGIAHNKDGKLMNRDGSLVANPNTSGGGGGAFSSPGFGPAVTDFFFLSSAGLCSFGGTIEFGTGETLFSMSNGPC